MIKCHSHTICGEFLSDGIFANTVKFAKIFGARIDEHTVVLHSKITPERHQITPDHTRSSQNQELGTDIFSLMGLTKQFSSL